MIIHNLKNNNSMKTQNTNKLAFTKSAVTELNDAHLMEINGGSTPTVTLAIVTIVVIEAMMAE
jgi:hypothetical protein